MVVRSYVAGRWFAPDSGSPVYDAATGDLVAEVSSDGIDFGAALAYGRSAGGPALREMTFHERAELAKAVGQMLREHREELYQLSYRTGATLADSKFDIDGGIGVLLRCAASSTSACAERCSPSGSTTSLPPGSTADVTGAAPAAGNFCLGTRQSACRRAQLRRHRFRCARSGNEPGPRR
jgi:acyl-CoA reductase-like NAD-dependent aldehyde dehydrogenase